MEYTRLGSSGLQVSRIALGTMGFGDGSRETWALDFDAAAPLFRQAIDLGITFWDTANIYGFGSSEKVVGRAIKELARRDDIVLATKVHQTVHEGPGGSGLSRKAIMEQIDASLTRLGTDYVDLYQIHRFDPETPVEETMEALHDVVKAGKARYLGASSMLAWEFAKMQHAAELNGWTAFVSMQDQYSLIQREEEREMFGLLADQGVGSLPWSPLAGGMLGRPWGDRSTTQEQGQRRGRLQRQSALAPHGRGHRRRGRTRCRSPWRLDGAGRAGLGAEEPGGGLTDRGSNQGVPPRRRCGRGRPDADRRGVGDPRKGLRQA